MMELTDGEDLLRWASYLTRDATNTWLVSNHAAVMLAWVQEAHEAHPRRRAGQDDWARRMAALRRVHLNRDNHDYPPDDDPAKFVRDARPFYTFLRSDPRALVLEREEAETASWNGEQIVWEDLLGPDLDMPEAD